MQSTTAVIGTHPRDQDTKSCICKRRVLLLGVDNVPSIYHQSDGRVEIFELQGALSFQSSIRIGLDDRYRVDHGLCKCSYQRLESQELGGDPRDLDISCNPVIQ